MIKFLVVDDEKGVSEQLRDFLKTHGFTAYSATSGKDALELAEKDNPNIVILDIRLPDINGIEVLRELKKINPKIRVIVLTGYPDETTRNISEGLGASAYIKKPYNFDEILKISRKIINEICREEGIA